MYLQDIKHFSSTFTTMLLGASPEARISAFKDSAERRYCGSSNLQI